MEAGKDVILDIEIQGAIQVCSKRPDTVRIFIAPPSWEELERRLRDRGYRQPGKDPEAAAAGQGGIPDGSHLRLLCHQRHRGKRGGGS